MFQIDVLEEINKTLKQIKEMLAKAYVNPDYNDGYNKGYNDGFADRSKLINNKEINKKPYVRF